MNIIYNKEVLAIPRRLMLDTGSVDYDPFEMFGTPYGMFIHIASTGAQFVRWVKRGMKDTLPRNTVYAFFVHISNEGEVMMGVADSEEDNITLTPCTTKDFSLMSHAREVSEAMTHCMKKCQTIQKAISFIDANNVVGMYNPLILFPSDWVAYAKEKGYDKTFYHTRFPNLEPKAK